ncbi:transposase [Stieleria varia]
MKARLTFLSLNSSVQSRFKPRIIDSRPTLALFSFARQIIDLEYSLPSPRMLMIPDATIVSATPSQNCSENVIRDGRWLSAQDDLDRLAHDPAFRAAVWDRPGQNVINERLASQPTQSRLISTLTANTGNLEAVRNGLTHSIEQHIKASGSGRRARHATIDIDSFPIEIHGKQKGASYNGYYNGYYKKTVYHPLVASFSVAGDYDSGRSGKRLGNGFIHATLRQGQVHTANGVNRFINTVQKQASKLAVNVDYPMDAGYTIPSVMDCMTDRNLRFVGRLKGNSKLDALAAEHVYRPAGRPPEGGYEYTSWVPIKSIHGNILNG